MTVEEKALALVNGIAVAERKLPSYLVCDRRNDSRWEALCRAIEAREADKKAFSDAVKKAIEDGVNEVACDVLSPFIQPEPEPDPLVEIWKRLWPKSAAPESSIAALRNALAARGYKIERIEQ